MCVAIFVAEPRQTPSKSSVSLEKINSIATGIIIWTNKILLHLTLTVLKNI